MDIPDDLRSDFAPGIYAGVPNEEYHADGSVSRSGLKRVAAKSIAHWRQYRQEDSDDGDFAYENAVHCAILEPQRFKRDYKIEHPPPDRPGEKSWSDNHLETASVFADGLSSTSIDDVGTERRRQLADDCPVSDNTVRKYLNLNGFGELVSHFREHDLDDLDTPLDPDKLEEVEAARESVERHPAASALLEHLEHARYECSIFSRDPSTGLDVRCRPDVLGWYDPHTAPAALKGDSGADLVADEPGWVIVDLKNARDASYWGFRKAVARGRYHLQDAFYRHVAGLELAGPIVGFVFLVVEKGIHEPALYTINSDGLERGVRQYHEALSEIVDSLEGDEWPGYAGDGEWIRELDVPGYGG